MKLHLSSATGRNVFTGYGDGFVLVNGERHERNLIVLPDRIIAWEATEFARLSREDFSPLAALGLEVLVLGTGGRLRFPHPRVTAPLIQAGVGVEVMDLQAACRTYNILAAESRRVAAALLFA